jgi:hypothetical protein
MLNMLHAIRQCTALSERLLLRPAPACDCVDCVDLPGPRISRNRGELEGSRPTVWIAQDLASELAHTDGLVAHPLGPPGPSGVA